MARWPFTQSRPLSDVIVTPPPGLELSGLTVTRDVADAYRVVRVWTDTFEWWTKDGFVDPNTGIPSAAPLWDARVYVVEQGASGPMVHTEQLRPRGCAVNVGYGDVYVRVQLTWRGTPPTPPVNGNVCASVSPGMASLHDIGVFQATSAATNGLPVVLIPDITVDYNSGASRAFGRAFARRAKLSWFSDGVAGSSFSCSMDAAPPVVVQSNYGSVFLTVDHRFILSSVAGGMVVNLGYEVFE